MSGWLRIVPATFLAVITVAGLQTAIAQDTPDIDACNGKNDASTQARIDGCTKLLDSGKYRGGNAVAIYYNRGNGYLAIPDFDKAIADYTQALAIKADHAAALNNRGLANAGKAQYDAAIADFDAAIKLDPGAIRYYNRGNVYLDRASKADLATAKPDYGRAIEDFNEAIKANADFAAAYNNLGVAYANRGEKGDIDSAISNYNEAVNREKDEKSKALFLYNRGLAKRERAVGKDVQEAEDDIKAAKDTDPGILDKFTRFGMK
jgi:tetratricopeptide (TPR) repeat protein